MLDWSRPFSSQSFSSRRARDSLNSKQILYPRNFTSAALDSVITGFSRSLAPTRAIPKLLVNLYHTHASQVTSHPLDIPCDNWGVKEYKRIYFFIYLFLFLFIISKNLYIYDLVFVFKLLELPEANVFASYSLH